MRVVGRVAPWLSLGILLYELYEQYGAGEAGYPETFGDWTQHSVCAGAQGVDIGFYAYAAALLGACPINQAGHGTDIGPTNFTGAFYKQHPHPISGLDSYDVAAKYTRPNPGSSHEPIPQIQSGAIFLPPPLPVEIPVPHVYPALDPFALPIGQPVPTPQPIPYPLLPYRRPNPQRSPHEQPDWGPQPAPRRIPNPFVWPGTGISIQRVPTPRPGQPSVEVRPSPSPGPSQGLRRPPGRRTKERKVTAKSLMGTPLWRAIGALTEGIDFIKAFHDALPPGCKKRFKRLKGGNRVKAVGRTSHAPQRMLQDLYRCWDDVDMNKAFENLAKNYFEDLAIGKANRGIARARNRNRRFIPGSPAPLAPISLG